MNTEPGPDPPVTSVCRPDSQEEKVMGSSWKLHFHLYFQQFESSVRAERQTKLLISVIICASLQESSLGRIDNVKSRISGVFSTAQIQQQAAFFV